jgi:hypothetical protein
MTSFTGQQQLRFILHAVIQLGGGGGAGDLFSSYLFMKKILFVVTS